MNPVPDDASRSSTDAHASAPPPPHCVLRVASLVIDRVSRTVTRDQRPLKLLPRQFALLVYLAEHANFPVSRQAIARDVWGDETAVWTNVITVNINGLRRELERPDLPTLLHTVRGQGYLLGDVPR